MMVTVLDAYLWDRIITPTDSLWADPWGIWYIIEHHHCLMKTSGIWKSSGSKQLGKYFWFYVSVPFWIFMQDYLRWGFKGRSDSCNQSWAEKKWLISPSMNFKDVFIRQELCWFSQFHTKELPKYMYNKLTIRYNMRIGQSIQSGADLWELGDLFHTDY